MTETLPLLPKQIITKAEVILWFAQNYPKVKQGTVEAHLTRMSINDLSRLHHKLMQDGSDDLFYKINAAQYRLYEQGTDPTPITHQSPPSISDMPENEPKEDNEVSGSSEFAYEHDLRDYLAKNLHLVEAGLKLYQEEGITGIEFPVGGRFIDILAVDSNGDYVVIELKVSKGYDRVVGQILRYIGWIEKYQVEEGKSVRGIIIANTITNDLKLACTKLPFIRLMEYALAMSLSPVE